MDIDISRNDGVAHEITCPVSVPPIGLNHMQCTPAMRRLFADTTTNLMHEVFVNFQQLIRCHRRWLYCIRTMIGRLNVVTNELQEIQEKISSLFVCTSLWSVKRAALAYHAHSVWLPLLQITRFQCFDLIWFWLRPHRICITIPSWYWNGQFNVDWCLVGNRPRPQCGADESR